MVVARQAQAPVAAHADAVDRDLLLVDFRPLHQPADHRGAGALVVVADRADLLHVRVALPGAVDRDHVEAAGQRDVVRDLREHFLALVHARYVDHHRRLRLARQHVVQAGDGLAVVEGHLDALDRVGRGLDAPVDHLAQLLVERLLHRVVVEEDRVLGHPVALDRMVVVVGGSRVRAHRLRALRKPLVPLGRLAPDLGQHAVVACARTSRHLDVVTLEVLHAAAHVQREVEHPLLVVALCAQLADHQPSPPVGFS